ncbi:hypothetical protein LTS18_004419 [Coniosporium uncinatum]|uniref:Uncharacterized protein n=1 Tax=Coniosporium uncinatum TaxID=93489 RepID=A0ACC3DYG4_9PEZI|nr:hypothetical protein LTS18_004419 [Coniosporium uncinatum]
MAHGALKIETLRFGDERDDDTTIAYLEHTMLFKTSWEKYGNTLGSLKSVYLPYFGDIVDSSGALRFFATCHNLVKLRMTGCARESWEDCEKAFFDMQFPNLDEFRTTHFNHDQVQYCSFLTRHAHSLRHLGTIRDRLSEGTWMEVYKVMKEQLALESLQLDGPLFHIEDVDNVADDYPLCTNVTSATSEPDDLLMLLVRGAAEIKQQLDRLIQGPMYIMKIEDVQVSWVCELGRRRAL